MDGQTVLIADSSEEFCEQLQKILHWVCRTECCTSGKKALSMLSEMHPDILLLDLMLPEMDGISILKTIKASGSHPVILATTCYLSDYMIEIAGQLNVSYLLVKPCDLQATAARVQEQLNLLKNKGSEENDLQFKISGLLMMMGFSVKLHGFKYLQEAVLQMLRTPDQSITKELYPGVGQVFGTAGSHVERSIRGAILAAWKNRDDRVWQLYFTPDGGGTIQKPTNAVFITRLADGLRVGLNSTEHTEFIPSPGRPISIVHG